MKSYDFIMKGVSLVIPEVDSPQAVGEGLSHMAFQSSNFSLDVSS